MVFLSGYRLRLLFYFLLSPCFLLVKALEIRNFFFFIPEKQVMSFNKDLPTLVVSQKVNE